MSGVRIETPEDLADIVETRRNVEHLANLREHVEPREYDRIVCGVARVLQARSGYALASLVNRLRFEAPSELRALTSELGIYDHDRDNRPSEPGEAAE